jgi:hypothetical protein
MGDSQFRGSAMKIRNLLRAKFEVTGMIKPGASSEKILNVHNLTTQDAIVISAGANDVYRNNRKIVLKQVTAFI